MSYFGNPGSSHLDAVRFYIGDTDPDNEILSDDEITALLTETGDQPFLAAALAAEAIAARYARRVDKSVGDLHISNSQLSKQYRDLASQLRSRATLSGAAAPYAGGISIADKQTVEANTDRVQPIFRRNLHDNPRAGKVTDSKAGRDQ
jgi:hypothetical protein